MAKEYPKHRRIKRVVEDAEAETDRTLPLLWDKWKHEGVEDILQPDSKTCL